MMLLSQALLTASPWMLFLLTVFSVQTERDFSLCRRGRDGGPVEEVWGQLGRALLGLRLTVYSTVLCGMPAGCVCVCDLGLCWLCWEEAGLWLRAAGQGLLFLCFGGWMECRSLAWDLHCWALALPTALLPSSAVWLGWVLSGPGFQLRQAPPPIRAVHWLLLLPPATSVCWRRLPPALFSGSLWL